MEITLTAGQRAALAKITDDVDKHCTDYVLAYASHIEEKSVGAERLAKMNRIAKECKDADIDAVITTLDERIAEAEAAKEE